MRNVITRNRPFGAEFYSSKAARKPAQLDELACKVGRAGLEPATDGL